MGFLLKCKVLCLWPAHKLKNWTCFLNSRVYPFCSQRCLSLMERARRVWGMVLLDAAGQKELGQSRWEMQEIKWENSLETAGSCPVWWTVKGLALGERRKGCCCFSCLDGSIETSSTGFCPARRPTCGKAAYVRPRWPFMNVIVDLEHRFWTQTFWAEILVMPFPSVAVWGMSLPVSVPQLSHLNNRDDSSTYF